MYIYAINMSCNSLFDQSYCLSSVPHKFVFAGNSKVKPIILLENIKHPTQGITRHCQPSRWNWSLSIKCNRSKVSSQTLLQGKEDVSFAKLHNVLLVWHGNRYTAIRAVGNIYTKSYCSILQQVRCEVLQMRHLLFPVAKSGRRLLIGCTWCWVISSSDWVGSVGWFPVWDAWYFREVW